MNQKKKRNYKHKKNQTKRDDPLFGLHQIDEDFGNPLEKEALIIMLRMLDNVDEFDSLRLDLRNSILMDKGSELRILDLLRTLISGIQVEQSALSKNHFTIG